jgi:branched-chain amino acid transport system permease protein
VLALTLPSFVVVYGVQIGLLYGLLAMGFVLIYRTNRILNFAQGQIGVVAAVFLVKLNVDYGFNYWFALVLGLGLAATVGAGSELLLRRLFRRPRVLVMVATIGLSQLLLAVAALPFIRPKHLANAFPVPIDLSFAIDGFVFGPGAVLTFIVAPLVAVGLAAFIRFSPWGLAMRATSENAESARLSGVWVRRASTLAWTLAGVLSAFTAILSAPGQTSSLTEVLSPDLLVLALTAALVGAMVNLTVAFVAGIGVGIVQAVLEQNFQSTATQELLLFALLLLVLLVRVGALRKGARTQERSTWLQGAVTVQRITDPVRRGVSGVGVWGALGIAALLPVVLSIVRITQFSEICIFAMIALSLTILTGWAGQVSLGQFGLVAVGSLMAAHLGSSIPLVLLLPFAGAVTAVIAVLIGLPALRIPGLYLAVATLGFAIFMDESVLATPCWTLPLVHKQLCTGLPNAASTLVARPDLFGISLDSEQSFAWFSLGVLVLTVLMVRVWRDRGVARRLVSVRDNEIAAGASGIPVIRTKLLAFALSGFIAGYAGVCYTFWDQRISTETFDPTISFLVIAMIVIGGLGSISGAVYGAVYLIGLPAIFGTTPSIQFLTGGLGLLAFILYLPGGLAEVFRRLGDVVCDGITQLRAPPTPPEGSPAGGPAPGPSVSAEPVT